MHFVSTNGGAPAVPASRAILQGLAPDGGLYVPEAVPHLPALPEAVADGAELGELARILLGPFLEDELGADELGRVIDDAFDFPLPVTPLGEGAPPQPELYLLELFHGPTLAFKDVGARFLARVLPRLDAVANPQAHDPLTVLVATSGDTGGAVARAFFGVEGTRVLVLYPEGQVTPRQERQFATLGGNVQAAAVAGTFDDCQRLVKAAFADRDLARRHRLTSANSISLGRLLPQMVYYAHAAARLAAGGEPRPPTFVVPSGNFGNLTAGLLAHRLGLPAAGFVAATNANDVVPEYLHTGLFEPRASISTLANAMDVGDPSNLARIRWLYGDDLEALRRDVEAVAFDDDAIRRGLAEAREATGRVLDPHTVVGWLAWRELRGDLPGPAVLLATAHPAKFAEVVEPVLGEEPPLPAALREVMERPLRSERIAAELGAVVDVLG